MIDISKLAGFPFSFNEDTWQFIFPQDYFILQAQTLFTVQDPTLRKYYLNPVTVLIKNIYASFWLEGKAGIWAELPFRFKFITLNRDYVGIETTKTKSIIVKKYPRLIDVVYGNVTVILFPEDLNPNTFENTRHKDVVIVELETSDKMIIPPKYVYAILNKTPSDYAIVLEVHHKKQGKNNLFVKAKGAPFFYVLRNTSHEIVKNPQYRFINKYAKLKEGRLKLLKKYNVSPKTPLLKQITRKVMLFSQLFSEDSANSLIGDINNNIDEVVDFSHPRF